MWVQGRAIGNKISNLHKKCLPSPSQPETELLSAGGQEDKWIVLMHWHFNIF